MKKRFTCKQDRHLVVMENERLKLVRCKRCHKLIDCEFKPSLMEQAKRNQ